MTEAFQQTGFVAHFFFSHSDKSRLEAAHLFSSYIKQIIGFLDINGDLCPQDIVYSVKRLYGPNRYRPSFGEIIDEIFIPLSEFLSKCVSSTTYVVDGLDECKPEEAQKVLKIFRKITPHGPSFFVSGRESLGVANSIPGSIVICISEEGSRKDIRKFIEWKIEEKMRERQLTESESVLQDIKNKLNGKADCMSVQHLWQNPNSSLY